jgi:hypothetical protein
MLEPLLEEIKHQGESKLNPYPLECLSMPHYTEKTGGLLPPQMPAPNLLRRHSADQTSEHQASHGILPVTPRLSQHIPLGRLTSLQKKKKKNNKQ